MLRPSQAASAGRVFGMAAAAWSLVIPATFPAHLLIAVWLLVRPDSWLAQKLTDSAPAESVSTTGLVTFFTPVVVFLTVSWTGADGSEAVLVGPLGTLGAPEDVEPPPDDVEPPDPCREPPCRAVPFGE